MCWQYMTTNHANQRDRSGLNGACVKQTVQSSSRDTGDTHKRMLDQNGKERLNWEDVLAVTQSLKRLDVIVSHSKQKKPIYALATKLPLVQG